MFHDEQILFGFCQDHTLVFVEPKVKENQQKCAMIKNVLHDLALLGCLHKSNWTDGDKETIEAQSGMYFIPTEGLFVQCFMHIILLKSPWWWLLW